jgi:hypothetical protein
VDVGGGVEAPERVELEPAASLTVCGGRREEQANGRSPEQGPESLSRPPRQLSTAPACS